MLPRMIVRCVVLASVVLTLTGCLPVGGSPPVSSGAPAPRAIETVPHDGAVELAVVAVREYLDVSAAISATGGVDTSAIDDVVSVEWRVEELAGFEAVRELGVAPVGVPTVTKLEVTALSGVSRVSEAVVAVCTSTTGLTVVDEDGTALPVEPEIHRLTIFVVARGDRFVVDGVEMMEDTTWCAE
jgi:hypothetical protein